MWSRSLTIARGVATTAIITLSINLPSRIIKATISSSSDRIVASGKFDQKSLIRRSLFFQFIHSMMQLKARMQLHEKVFISIPDRNKKFVLNRPANLQLHIRGMKFLRIIRRNRKINGPAGKSTKDVAVKEEPADRSYVEPLPVTNISSATSQDTQNGKRFTPSNSRIDRSFADVECREWERASLVTIFSYDDPRRDKSLHKRVHVARYSTPWNP